MSRTDEFTVRKKTMVMRGPVVVLGDGRARLLALVDETGSIKVAAERMGMSYRHAWGKLRHIAEAAGGEVLESSRGGPEGGRTSLTPLGRKILDLYRDASR